MYTIFIVNVFRLYRKSTQLLLFFSKYRTYINLIIINSEKFEKKKIQIFFKSCADLLVQGIKYNKCPLHTEKKFEGIQNIIKLI